MSAIDIMEPLTSDGDIPTGALVWGSDYNAASALLYRWWGLFEAPVDVDTSGWFAGLFADEARIRTPHLQAETPAAAAAEAQRLRRSGRWAHRLGYDDLRLRWLGADSLELAATFSVDEQSPGSSCVRERRVLSAQLNRAANGGLCFRTIDDRREEPGKAAEFEPSYEANRALSLITQFQAHMDSLRSDAEPVRELLMPDLELHGLIASKRDESQGDGAALNDIGSLRRSMAGGGPAPANVIRDFDGFAAWVRSASALFRYGLHKLEDFRIRPTADRRFEIVAQFDWRAQTVNGAKIELHQPLTWIIVETGERFMRIEKLLPFG